jgi:hypothetical protein
MTRKQPGVYSRKALREIKASALKIKGSTSTTHIYPRAYCIAKPAPLCAVFVTPWMDSEPAVRTPMFSSAHTIHDGVREVKVGDWCSLAYVTTPGRGGLRVIEILK